MHCFVCPAPPGLGRAPLFPGKSTQSHSIHMTPVGATTWSCSQDWLGGMEEIGMLNLACKVGSTPYGVGRAPLFADCNSTIKMEALWSQGRQQGVNWSRDQYSGKERERF